MFGYGAEGDGWQSVGGRELDHLTQALREKLEDDDYERLDVGATERGYTPFYGTAHGDDDSETTARLYRVPQIGTDPDPEGNAVETTYFYGLVLLRRGWAEAIPKAGTPPRDASAADTPSVDPAESDQQRENEEELLLQMLDGTSPPIHEINARYGLSLFEPDDEDLSEQKQKHVLHYLRFFCEFVHGEGGPFYIIDRDQEVEITPDGQKRLDEARKAAARDRDVVKTECDDHPGEQAHTPNPATEANADAGESVDAVRSDSTGAPGVPEQTEEHPVEANSQASSKAPRTTDAEHGDVPAADEAPSRTEGADGPADERTEHAAENDDTVNDRHDDGVRPRWRQQPGPPTEFAGLDGSEAIALARVVYSEAGFTAKFGVQANGMIEMKGDDPELHQHEVKVRRPLRIFSATFKFVIPEGTPTIREGQLSRLLEGALPPEDAELPEGVTIQGDVLVIRGLEIVPDGPEVDVARDWRRSKRRFSKVKVERCVGRDVVIKVSNTRVRHDLEFVHVMALGLDGSATRFDGKLDFHWCSFVGVEVGRNEHKANEYALDLQNAAFGGRLQVIESLVSPAHKRSGQRITPLLPASAFMNERPRTQVNLDGVTTTADIWMRSSCFFGSTRLFGARLGGLWLANCSVIGDVKLT
ncbi:MAG: hypothetical protein ACFCBV_08335 [Phycisphaerales bacterium]